MAGSNIDSEDDGITDINVTPLVDVMLVLLIIFMVTANYINTQAIEMNLPSAQTGEATGPKSLNFSLSKNSGLYLDGEKISFAQLPELLKNKKKANPKVQALIAADVATPHGSVVKLIDVIRKSGVTDFAINVEVEATSEQ